MDLPASILTGDLIRSTSLSGTMLDDAFEGLADAASEIAAWTADTPAGFHSTRFTRSRGDGWQIILFSPRLVLRSALYLRASLRRLGHSVDTRIAIATGIADSGLGSDLNSAVGPAFVESGRKLDDMREPATMAHVDGGPMAAVVRLADYISQGWTEAQAKAMYHMLWPSGRTRNSAARAIGVSRQAVDQALASAGYHALKDAMNLIEADG